MKKSTILCIFLSLFLCLFFALPAVSENSTAQGATPEANPFVGMWKGEGSAGQKGIMTFYPDMTYVLPSGCCGGGESGRYAYSGTFPDFLITFFVLVPSKTQPESSTDSGVVSGSVHFTSETQMRLYDSRGLLRATLTK